MTERELVDALIEDERTREVGGEEVEALHYRRTRNLSGAQSGVERIDVWFQAGTGLVVQNERDAGPLRLPENRADDFIDHFNRTYEGVGMKLTPVDPISPAQRWAVTSPAHTLPLTTNRSSGDR